MLYMLHGVYLYTHLQYLNTWFGVQFISVFFLQLVPLVRSCREAAMIHHSRRATEKASNSGRPLGPGAPGMVRLSPSSFGARIYHQQRLCSTHLEDIEVTNMG